MCLNFDNQILCSIVSTIGEIYMIAYCLNTFDFETSSHQQGRLEIYIQLMLKSHSTFVTPRIPLTLKSELRNMANNKNLPSKIQNLTNTSKTIAAMQPINQKWVIWEKCDRCSSSVHLIHNMLHDPIMLHLSRQYQSPKTGEQQSLMYWRTQIACVFLL